MSEESLGSAAFWQELQEQIYNELQQLSAEPSLLEKRYERFRRMGQSWIREGGEAHVSPLL